MELGSFGAADSFPLASPLRWLPLERAIKFTPNLTTNEWLRESIQVRIQPEPFESGSLRVAYRMQIDSDPSMYVLKLPKRIGQNPEISYQDVKMQMIAKNYAKLFNDKGVPKKVDFLDAFVLELTDRGSLTVGSYELYIEGEYVKYNNNIVWHDDTRNTPQTFSHFSFVESHGQLLICDIQGVGDMFTDPQIHSAGGRGFGIGNHGPRGIENFLANHSCNAICRFLNLPPTPNREPKSDELGTGPRAVLPTSPAASSPAIQSPLPPHSSEYSSTPVELSSALISNHGLQKLNSESENVVVVNNPRDSAQEENQLPHAGETSPQIVVNRKTHAADYESVRSPPAVGIDAASAFGDGAIHDVSVDPPRPSRSHSDDVRCHQVLIEPSLPQPSKSPPPPQQQQLPRDVPPPARPRRRSDGDAVGIAPDWNYFDPDRPPAPANAAANDPSKNIQGSHGGEVARGGSPMIAVFQKCANALAVTVHECRHLLAKNSDGGSRPYFTVALGSQRLRSKVVGSTTSPVWNMTAVFDLSEVCQNQMKIHFWNKSDVREADDFLGVLEFRIDPALLFLCYNRAVTQWYTLQGSQFTKTAARGDVMISFKSFDRTDRLQAPIDPRVLHREISPPPGPTSPPWHQLSPSNLPPPGHHSPAGEQFQHELYRPPMGYQPPQQPPSPPPLLFANSHSHPPPLSAEHRHHAQGPNESPQNNWRTQHQNSSPQAPPERLQKNEKPYLPETGEVVPGIPIWSSSAPPLPPSTPTSPAYALPPVPYPQPQPQLYAQQNLPPPCHQYPQPQPPYAQPPSHPHPHPARAQPHVPSHAQPHSPYHPHPASPCAQPFSPTQFQHSPLGNARPSRPEFGGRSPSGSAPAKREDGPHKGSRNPMDIVVLSAAEVEGEEWVLLTEQ